ncbi:MAG: low molecular weight phosphatase family protein [Actinomycetota bacterium]
MKTILFVCTENAGRSQLAEAVFNSMAPASWQATSAGTRPATRVYPNTVEVLRETGMNIEKNGPRLLTPQLVAGANIVITMGCGDEGCPILPVDSQNWDLPDLKGKSIEDFRELRNLITVKCERLLREIES